MRALLIFTLAFPFLISCETSINRNSETPASKAITPNDSIPVVIIRSYFNRIENLTLDELRMGLESGRIACTSDIADRLTTKLQLEKSPVTKPLGEFSRVDSTSFMVTSIDSLKPCYLVTSLNGSHFFKDRLTYLLWVADSTSHDYSKAITSYTHTGVTALTRRTGSVLNTLTPGQYLELIKPEIGSPDLLHISNEVSMLDLCDYGSMKMKFATKSEHFRVLEELGADLVELTGNHNLDVGTEPYTNTIKWYQEKGMKTFGGGLSPEEAGAPLIMTLNDGRKAAWIGFNEICPCGECADKTMGSNRYSDASAKSTIDALKSRGDIEYILACVQFGESDSYVPTSSQKRISKYLVDCGADVVIGSQAHQPQTFEWYKERMIFYGIGNFMFDQIHRIGVRQAYFLECYFYKGRIVQFIPHFTFMGDDRRPAPANASNTELIKKAVYLPSYMQSSK